MTALTCSRLSPSYHCMMSSTLAPASRFSKMADTGILVPFRTHAPLTLPGMLSTAEHCDQSRVAIPSSLHSIVVLDHNAQSNDHRWRQSLNALAAWPVILRAFASVSSSGAPCTLPLSISAIRRRVSSCQALSTDGSIWAIFRCCAHNAEVEGSSPSLTTSQTGPCLATARRRLRASAGAVDDIDLQLLEFGDALIDALVPHPGHRRPVFLQQRESVWQGGQLRRDFLEAEAGALPDRDVADL